MCGISGLVSVRSGVTSQVLQDRIDGMVKALRHRGPDDTGTFLDSRGGIALGHNRLSIVDLSPMGHQPMASRTDRFIVIFNGEIYNFLDLRREMETRSYEFRSQSDTEVLLAAFEEWGVEATLPRIDGMFAFAVLDRGENTLTLARDRVGKKPLYYGRFGEFFAFASELKAFRALPEFEGSIDEEALSYYRRLQFIPAPMSIYKNVFKLLQGTFFTFDLSQRSGVDLKSTRKYWDLTSFVRSPAENHSVLTFRDAHERLDSLLCNAVRKRMVADVPVGAFLSGGIDSTLIVALMRAEVSSVPKTFTVGFEESGFNESDEARSISEYLETDHTELFVTSREALSVIPELPRIYDEPFADSSQIPSCLISRLTRSHVTVALSGDGGDEIFGGYNRYIWGSNIWRFVRLMPTCLQRVFSRFLASLSPALWQRIEHLSMGRSPRNLSDKIQKLAMLLPASTFIEFFQRLVSVWPDEAEYSLPHASDIASIQANDLRIMLLSDTLLCLPDDMLVKVDRSSMSTGLEVRCPLLDHHVVEFAATLPTTYLVQGLRGKMLLREVLKKYVPEELWKRPKTGFSIPLADWLRGPLREWAEDLLSESRLRATGAYEPKVVREMMAEHFTGRRNWQDRLWNVLMFQAWFDETGSAIR